MSLDLCKSEFSFSLQTSLSTKEVMVVAAARWIATVIVGRVGTFSGC